MASASTDISPVYLIYGPESYLVHQEIEQLMDRVISSKERDMNLHLFHGGDHSAEEMVQAAQTLPMFSKYRFVLVSEADQIDDEGIEVLQKYILDPSPTTCLVMSAQSLGSLKKLRAQIEKKGRVIECSRMKGKGLTSWMRNRMKGRGKALSEEAAGYLAEMMGDHLQDIDNTLERLSLSVGARGTIELADLEGVVSDVKISTIFDLTDAIGQRDMEKAIGILGKAMESKTISFKKDEDSSKKMDDPTPLLLSMMVRQYRSIWRVKEAVSRRLSAEEAAKALKMSPWVVKNLMTQGKGFTEASLRETILRCHQTDLAIKRGRGPKELLMEKLVIDLCRPIQSSASSHVAKKG